MSGIYGKMNNNNYHYNPNKYSSYKMIGTTFDPYKPKESNPKMTEQILGRYKRNTEVENPYSQNSKRNNSNTALINNSYNIINNNPYSRSPNYNIYINEFKNKDHIKDLLNIFGDKNPYYDKNNKRDNNNNKTELYNHINKYNSYNNNAKVNSDEKISNNNLVEYSEDNCGTLIKNFAYNENPNAGNRNYMEDKGKSIINLNGNPDEALFCLFDGHGGDNVSIFLQQNFDKFFKEILPINAQNYDYKLKNLFSSIDNQIKEKNYDQVGSTATIVYIVKESGRKILYCANIGDTRCVLIKSMEYKRLSYDDRASDEKESNRIIQEGGVVFGGRVYGQLMLTRAFGDMEFKSHGVLSEPHVTRVMLNEEDKYIIIASDGVWDVINDEEIYEMSKMYIDSKEFCKNIVQTSINKGSMDNISCFVISVN